MTYDEIAKAMDEARWLMQRADTVAEKVIPFAVGRLQHLDLNHDTLRRLKRELADFNSHTGKWRA